VVDEERTRAQDVLPNINHMQAAKIPPPQTATEWSSLLLCDVVCNEHGTMHYAAELTIRSLPAGGGVMEVKSTFFALGDLDL